MGERAKVLAERFEKANGELLTVVEQCSDVQWKAVCEVEGWAVGVTVHHLAVDHTILARVAEAVAMGQAVPALTSEIINQFNAQHAQQHASCSIEETLELLRRNGAAAANTIQGLSDEQLDRRGVLPWEGEAPWSAQEVIEKKLIGHIEEHLASIRAAMNRAMSPATSGRTAVAIE